MKATELTRPQTHGNVQLFCLKYQSFQRREMRWHPRVLKNLETMILTDIVFNGQTVTKSDY